MITTAIEIFASPFFPLVTLLLGFLVGHRLAIGRDRRKEFNKAAAEFKTAFIPELRYLADRYSAGIYKILALAFDRHEIAVIKFRPNLCCQQHIGFDKAWNDYCDKENGKPRFMVYAEPDDPIGIIDKRNFYLEKLNTLLKFADPKH